MGMRLLNSAGVAQNKATGIGMLAVLLWSASFGLFRSIAEIFGAVGGAALIFTASCVFSGVLAGWPRLRSFNRTYLLLGGGLFIAYEIALSLSIGFAHNRVQSMELAMINYMWPCLTIVFAVVFRQQKASWWLLPGAALCLLGVVTVMRGNTQLTLPLLWSNVLDNPVAYTLAMCAAILWAVYSVVIRRYGNGQSALVYFLIGSAVFLWGQYALHGGGTLHWSASGAIQVLVLGVFSATAYACWHVGMQAGNVVMLATASYFTPVLTLIMASLWLGLTLGAGFWMGALLVTTGSLVCWYSTRRGA